MGFGVILVEGKDSEKDKYLFDGNVVHVYLQFNG